MISGINKVTIPPRHLFLTRTIQRKERSWETNGSRNAQRQGVQHVVSVESNVMNRNPNAIIVKNQRDNVEVSYRRFTVLFKM